MPQKRVLRHMSSGVLARLVFGYVMGCVACVCFSLTICFDLLRDGKAAAWVLMLSHLPMVSVRVRPAMSKRAAFLALCGLSAALLYDCTFGLLLYL